MASDHDNPRDSAITVRVADSTRQAYKIEASRQDMSMSKWIRSTLSDALSDVAVASSGPTDTTTMSDKSTSDHGTAAGSDDNDGPNNPTSQTSGHDGGT